MTGPRVKPIEEKAPPTEVIIPRLSEAEIKRRASEGFDRAVRTINDPQIKQLKSEFATLRPKIISAITKVHKTLPFDDSLSEDERNSAYQDAISKVVDQHIEQNPNSPLTEFIKLGNSVVTENGLSLSWNGPQIRITKLELRTADAEAAIRTRFDPVKSPVVELLVRASKQLGPYDSTSYALPINEMDPAQTQRLADALALQLSTPETQKLARGHLPVGIKYTEEEQTPSLAFNYTGPRTTEETY